MKTVRRPPYPKWNPGYFPCSSLTPPSAFLTPSIGVLRWIRVYVTGAEYRMNVFEDFTRFDPEWFGIMSVRPGAADPQGEYSDVYSLSVLEGGTMLTFGEPKMEVMLPLQYPFVDADKTKHLWEIEMRSFAPAFGSQGSYGVGYMFNPAAFDEGFNKDPLYANDPAAQNRGPWIKVFDNRENAPK